MKYGFGYMALQTVKCHFSAPPANKYGSIALSLSFSLSLTHTHILTHYLSHAHTHTHSKLQYLPTHTQSLSLSCSFAHTKVIFFFLSKQTVNGEKIFFLTFNKSNLSILFHFSSLFSLSLLGQKLRRLYEKISVMAQIYA